MKKYKLKKWLFIATISIAGNSLYANENSQLMSKVWMRQNGNCMEGYSFSQNNNIFAYTATTGKRVMGTYLLEKISNSDRLKLTLYFSADNRLYDCFNGNYDLAQKTIVLYVIIDTKNNLLKMSDNLTGNFFGFYSLNHQFSQSDETLFFNTIYNALVADMQAIQQNVQNTYQEQQNNQNNSTSSSSDMFSLMDKYSQRAKNAQAIVDYKLQHTSPEKADKFRQEMIDNNWRRMDARTEHYKTEQLEDNRIQELNHQEDIQNDYYNQ